MKILVPIKRVVDANVRVRLKADGSGADLAGVKMAINPFDQIAIEEALRLKEKGAATNVVAVSVGVAAGQDVLRTALAMGADSAILIEMQERIEPLGVAKLLAAIIGEESPDLVIMGKQAIDDDANQTGQMLAALLNWPQATFASKLDVDTQGATVVREIDGGLQTLRLALPAVVTTDLRLNEPRYASLPSIMKAKSKPLVIRQAAEFGLDIAPRLEILAILAPPSRQRGKMLGSADELAAILKTHAGLR